MQGSLWDVTPRRWVAHVDMDAFFASVEQLDNPGLRNTPLIVGNSPLSIERLRELSREVEKLGRPPEFIKGIRGVVASASYEARAFGVRSAMPLARALVLCPGAVVLPGRFDRYRAVARTLHKVWSEFSPVVEPVSLDEAYLDMTGCELVDGPLDLIGRRLKARIKEETGLTASVGIASSKLVAKIASDLRKPDGLVVVAQGDEASTLANLPVRALPGVGPRSAEVLLKLGIRTVGDLAAIPHARLATAVGRDNAHSLLNKAAGIDNNPVQVPGDPKSISREVTLAEDTCDLVELGSLLKVLSDRVGWMLRREGFCARCIYIKLRLLARNRTWTPEGSSFGRLITRRCTLSSPTDRGDDVFSAASRLLSAAAGSTGLGEGTEVVRLLGVGTAALVRSSAFSFGSPENGQVKLSSAEHEPALEAEGFAPSMGGSKLDAGLDAIRDKFGYGAITLATAVKRQDIEHTPD